MHFDFTVSFTTLLQLPILGLLGYVVRFISIQKDFPPHRHVNGQVLYPKDYAPEKAQAMGAGSSQ
jgi:hypothetical protein